jgi:hypothetical protein
MGNENKRRKEKEEKRDGKFAYRPATPYSLSLSLFSSISFTDVSPSYDV